MDIFATIDRISPEMSNYRVCGRLRGQAKDGALLKCWVRNRYVRTRFRLGLIAVKFELVELTDRISAFF